MERWQLAGALLELTWQRKTDVRGENTCPSANAPTTNPTRNSPGHKAAAVRGRRRSAWAKARSHLRTTHPPRTTRRWGGQLHTLAASLPMKLSHIRSTGNRTVLRGGSDDVPTYRDCASHNHSAQQIRGSEERCHSPTYTWNTVYCTTETCLSLSLPHKRKRSRPLALRDSQRKYRKKMNARGQ